MCVNGLFVLSVNSRLLAVKFSLKFLCGFPLWRGVDDGGGHDPNPVVQGSTML